MKSTLLRAIRYLREPELCWYYIKIRWVRLYTRLSKAQIDLTTRSMHAEGIGRFAKDGRLFFTYRGGCYPESVAGGDASKNIRNVALRYCKGTGLDIGSSRWPLPGAHAVDKGVDENAFRLDRWPDGSLDFIFSSHCLEHLAEWRKALILWVSKLKPGGILFLYLPHSSMTLWQPGSPWVGDDHVWSPSLEAIAPVLQHEHMTIIAADPGPDVYYSFHIIARRDRQKTQT